MLYRYVDENGEAHYWYTAAPAEFRGRLTSSQPNAVQSFVVETKDGEAWRRLGKARITMADEKKTEEPAKEAAAQPAQAVDKPHEEPAKEPASTSTASTPATAPAQPPPETSAPGASVAAPAATGTAKPPAYDPTGFAPTQGTHLACPGCNATNNVSKKSWLTKLEEAFERRCADCGRWLGLHAS